MKILTNYARSYEIEGTPDNAEKIADVGLGLLRLGFGKTFDVRNVKLVNGQTELFFELQPTSTLTRVIAIGICILAFPLTLVLATIGCIAFRFSKTHKETSLKLEKRINICPVQENQKILKEEDTRIKETREKKQIKFEEIEPKIELEKSFVIYNRRTEKYVYISEAPPIKNLVISGGGAKGVILTGVIEAFEEHKTGKLSFIDQLDFVSGSSVGALTAALLASGITAASFTQIMKSQDYEELLGEGKGPVYKCGKPMLEFMRKNMQKAIKERLIVKFGSLENVPNEAKGIVEVLNKTETDAYITFSMFRTLHQIDPHGFKEIIITATNINTGKIEYLDADNNPDLEVALASRASASLPIILKPVKIGNHTYIDGGYLDNIPVDSVTNKQGEQKHNKGLNGQNLQTLAVTFEESEKTKKGTQSPLLNYTTKQHSIMRPTRSDRIIRNFVAKKASGLKTEEVNTIAKEKRLEDIRENYAHRNIPLRVSVSATDFKKAKRKEDWYRESGREQAEAYLKLHSGELMYRSFDSKEELLDYIPEDLREKVRNHFYAG